MSRPIVSCGALPYSDGSGYEIEIVIDPPNDHFKYVRVKLNPDSEFCDFDIEQWPEVRAAIDRAVQAARLLSPPQKDEPPPWAG